MYRSFVLWCRRLACQSEGGETPAPQQDRTLAVEHFLASALARRATESYNANGSVFLRNVEQDCESRNELDAKPADARFADRKWVGTKSCVKRFDASRHSLSVVGSGGDVRIGQLIEGCALPGQGEQWSISRNRVITSSGVCQRAFGSFSCRSSSSSVTPNSGKDTFGSEAGMN
ncbi:hypothetical protein [Frigoriglobus tundricola]|uniref:hypothetical protein n=1 Tax=Frigoriglobus tundricola TaxID=2774151 RepID=UPI00148EC3EF|nr:hypothetical protein [Frigoriglobus tundricola]